MSDHLSIGDIEQYRSRKLPLAALLSANDHLADCVTCRELFEKPGQLEETYSFVRAGLQESAGEAAPHLNYEHMAAYVDEFLSEQERSIVEIHLESCKECGMEVDELRGARAGSLFRPFTAGIDLSRGSRGLSAKVRRSGYRVPVQVASILAIAVVCGLVATLLVQMLLARKQAQLNELQITNEELRKELDDSNRAVADLQAQLQPVQEPAEEFGTNVPQNTSITLNDAEGTVILDGQGTVFGLGVLRPRDQRLIRQALTSGKAETPATLTELLGKPNKLMGTDQNSFSLISPVGTVVLTNRPTLRWEPLSGASGYVVTILDSSFNEVETSPPLSETAWTVTHPLRSGGRYVWQVRAIKDGTEIRSPATTQGEAKFRVLERSKAIEVERISRTFANSHLALGVIYADAGLLDDAKREFEALAGANPQSGIAKNLVDSLKRRSAK